MSVTKSHLKLAVVLCSLCFLGSNTQPSGESLLWVPQLESQFQQRSLELISISKGGDYGNTDFENEKKSYPKAMLDFLAGNKDEAIAFLQSND